MKFFTSLSIYPTNKKLYKPYIHHVAATNIDILAHEVIDYKLESELDEWLRNCVSTHPRVDSFKTMHFLDESTIL